jgi:hypothetical protein
MSPRTLQTDLVISTATDSSYAKFVRCNIKVSHDCYVINHKHKYETKFLCIFVICPHTKYFMHRSNISLLIAISQKLFDVEVTAEHSAKNPYKRKLHLFKDLLACEISRPYIMWQYCHSHLGSSHGRHVDITDGRKPDVTKIQRYYLVA